MLDIIYLKRRLKTYFFYFFNLLFYFLFLSFSYLFLSFSYQLLMIYFYFFAFVQYRYIFLNQTHLFFAHLYFFFVIVCSYIIYVVHLKHLNYFQILLMDNLNQPYLQPIYDMVLFWISKNFIRRYIISFFIIPILR